ncbi:MAG: hypothetical protein IJO45_05460 [Oscillospiraceae bacterium]|nr:hypothetical protein [Oscillospiraceae bacterium]
MRKWLYPAALLAAIGILSRLPHPAKDITRLKPVRAVYLYGEAELLTIETDTGDSGSGPTVSDAYGDMKAKADGEIFLDTAEFLILSPEIPVTAEFYKIFRPTCKLVISDTPPDLETVSDYLAIHTPKTTLAQIRAFGYQEQVIN